MFERQVAAFNDQVKIRSARNQSLRLIKNISSIAANTFKIYNYNSVNFKGIHLVSKNLV